MSPPERRSCELPTPSDDDAPHCYPGGLFLIGSRGGTRAIPASMAACCLRRGAYDSSVGLLETPQLATRRTARRMPECVSAMATILRQPVASSAPQS